MRRALLPWLVALGIALLAGVATVVVLNATVLGAGGFVRVYLDALARDDVSDALSLPGVHPGGRSAALLEDGTLTGLSGIHQTADEVRGGEHWVTVDWTTPHGSGSTTFVVERIGTRFGLFPEWGFAISPVATVELTVAHDARFTVNGVDEVSTVRANQAVPYAVLVPGEYVFANRTAYLTADPETLLADTVGQTLTGTVDSQANGAFVKAVATVVDRQLAACATQAVLFPSGCTFGQSITDRVSSAPTWTIVREPELTIVPGETFGTWAIPGSPGTAHLKVEVTALYDGTTSDFDQDVPFQVTADITLGDDGSITVIQR